MKLRLFQIPSPEEKTDTPQVREQYAMSAGITGILVNALLCIVKLIAGYWTGSVGIIADAFNNLSDAGSSVISIVGIRLSGKHADKEHPLGHGRMEYITSFIIDVMIILVGFELLQSAFDKILHPAQPDISTLTLVLLGIAIAAKLLMYFYYRAVGNRIHSPALRAASLDSIGDTVSTFVVFLTALISRFSSLQLDGWAGLLVSAFILYTGFKASKETVELLLGASPDPVLVTRIYAFIKQYPEIVGIHDLMIHDYGPGRQIVTLHAEVSENSDLVHVHEVIDLMEKDMKDQFGCIATIHMDPIAVGNAQVDALRQFAEDCAKEVDPNFSIHDFRMVRGDHRTNLIFDLCIPLDSPHHDEDAAEMVAQLIHSKRPDCFAVIRAEHPFI